MSETTPDDDDEQPEPTQLDAERVKRNGPGRPVMPIAHGTNRGAIAHRKRGEKPCEPCRVATNEYQREWRRRSGRTGSVRVPLSILRDAAMFANGPTRTALLSLIEDEQAGENEQPEPQPELVEDEQPEQADVVDVVEVEPAQQPQPQRLLDP